MTHGWWALVLALLSTTPTVPEPPRPEVAFSGAPKIGYVEDHVLRLPGGERVQLPKRWGVTGIAAYDGGYLVSDDRVFEGTVGMARLDADGKVLDQWSGTGPPVTSRDGRLAWVSLAVSEADQHGPTVLHADSVDGGAEVTQRIGRTRIPFLTGWWHGRLVYRTWGQDSSFLTDLAAAPRPVPLVEDLGEVSPDGRLSARTTVQGIEVRQSDGQLVNVIKEPGLTRTQTNDLAWEDGRHLLATLTRGHRMCVVRVGLYGRITRATPWQRAGTTGFAFLGL
jgi:hypothetical protein